MTVQPKNIRAALAQLRQSAKLGKTALARKLGWQHPKVVLIENGVQGVSVFDVALWAKACGYQARIVFSKTTKEKS